MAGLVLAWAGDRFSLPSVLIVPLAVILVSIGFIALIIALS